MDLRRLVVALLLVVGTAVSAQDVPINEQLSRLMNEKSDRVKDSLATVVSVQLAEFLKTSSPASYNFKELKNVGVVASPDKAFTLYLYNLMYRDGSFRHFGFVQLPEGSGFKVVPLTDRRDAITNPNFMELTPDSWYGALYYDVIPTEFDGKKYYILLGNSFNNLFTSRKVIEVLQVTPNGLIFGAPIFFDGKKKAERVIFEYSARTSMTLKYIPELKSIIFDHLTSTEPGSSDFQFFGPDGGIDGFTFDKGIWTLKQNFDVRLPKQPKKKGFNVSNF